MKEPFRDKLFHWIVYSLMKHNPCMVLPVWGMVIHCILFPIRSMYLSLERSYGYDIRNDIWSMYGTKISGSTMRSLSSCPPGTIFELLPSDPDQPIKIKILNDVPYPDKVKEPYEPNTSND